MGNEELMMKNEAKCRKISHNALKSVEFASRITRMFTLRKK